MDVPRRSSGDSCRLSFTFTLWPIGDTHSQNCVTTLSSAKSALPCSDLHCSCGSFHCRSSLLDTKFFESHLIIAHPLQALLLIFANCRRHYTDAQRVAQSLCLTTMCCRRFFAVICQVVAAKPISATEHVTPPTPALHPKSSRRF